MKGHEIIYKHKYKIDYAGMGIPEYARQKPEDIRSYK
jgi:hypothetical protein